MYVSVCQQQRPNAGIDFNDILQTGSLAVESFNGQNRFNHSKWGQFKYFKNDIS